MSLPSKCVVDTNVPKVANLATQSDPESDFPETCVEACVDAVGHVVRTRGLILDAGNEIYDEYMGNLAAWSQQPGVGDIFMKWVHDRRGSLNASQKVSITRNGDSYDEFPHHDGLENFDISDRKFVAVSNAHPEKPAILQATDSKWWGWKEALKECGIEVAFLCPDYVEAKFAGKLGR
ncbi:MAG: hypothetical protein F4Z95_11155 [Gammaproteobacteria bacterium]|nr:hypothetical protein [Gammaproteobacteria bacterium]